MNVEPWVRGPFAVHGAVPLGRTRGMLRWGSGPRLLYGLQRGRVAVALDADGYRVHNLACGMFICWARTLPAAIRAATLLAPAIPEGRFGQKPDPATQARVIALVDDLIAAAPADYAYIDAWTDRRYHCSWVESRRRWAQERRL